MSALAFHARLCHARIALVGFVYICEQTVANVPRDAPLDANEVESAHDELRPQPNLPAPTPLTDWDRFWHIVSSGLFFMVVGTAFLIVATVTIGRIHAGTTFIFVVVGVAVLLYGTGTQATGAFDASPQADATYRLRLAGGAGALAFAVGAGIVFFKEDINGAFREEFRYFEIMIPAADDGVTNLENYVVGALVNDEQIPTKKRGKYVVALVPTRLNDGTRPRTLVLTLAWSAPQPVPTNLEPRHKTPEIDISRENPAVVSGGMELQQVWLDTHKVSLIRQRQVVTLPEDESESGVSVQPD
jgi:hypothetical protein